MVRAVVYCFCLAVLGLIIFALVVPLLLKGNLRETGATALPVIVIGCGALGFVLGLRSARGKKPPL